MKKQTPKIDLSKVKVGQRVRLRNGEIAQFQGASQSTKFPYLASIESGGIETYTKTGTVFEFSGSNFDIIEILPMAKKKAQPLKPSKLSNAREITRIAMQLRGKPDPKVKTIRAAIKLLEGLLK